MMHGIRIEYFQDCPEILLFHLLCQHYTLVKFSLDDHCKKFEMIFDFKNLFKNNILPRDNAL